MFLEYWYNAYGTSLNLPSISYSRSSVDCISLAKSKSSKPHVHISKPLALRPAMNNFICKIIHELCTCGFELLTLLLGNPLY